MKNVTYHVFYQFLASTTPVLSFFNLEDVFDYASSGCYRPPSVPFSDDDSIAAAQTLGFKPKHFSILLFGNFLQLTNGDAHESRRISTALEELNTQRSHRILAKSCLHPTHRPQINWNQPSINYTRAHDCPTGPLLVYSTTKRTHSSPRDIPLSYTPQHHPDLVSLGSEDTISQQQPSCPANRCHFRCKHHSILFLCCVRKFHSENSSKLIQTKRISIPRSCHFLPPGVVY
jgi:hypothetical protein